MYVPCSFIPLARADCDNSLPLSVMYFFLPPTILPSSLMSSCHLFLGLPLKLVFPKFIYNFENFNLRPRGCNLVAASSARCQTGSSHHEIAISRLGSRASDVRLLWGKCKHTCQNTRYKRNTMISQDPKDSYFPKTQRTIRQQEL